MSIILCTIFLEKEKSIAMGSVDYELSTSRIKKGLARHPIPVVILARLAVDLGYQKKIIGVSLLKIELSLYTILQILSISLFKKMPIYQVLTDNGYSTKIVSSHIQLKLFDS